VSEGYEDINEEEDNEKEDHGNIVVKFCVLLFLCLVLVIMLGMFGAFILEISHIRLTGYIDIRPIVAFLVGLVLGYIIRDYSLRESKN
jgi:hypothetical protein